MKKLLLCLTATLTVGLSQVNAQSYAYKVITSVESIVPNGLGRSRIIDENENRDYKNFTTQRSAQNNGRNKSKRGDIRVKNFDETKLLNFYNLGGIRFQNIAANDALITSKINDLVANGWQLAFVTSAVESDAGKGDGHGIFITRYIFKKAKG